MSKLTLLKELHPGRTILENVLKPLGLSVNALVKQLRMPTTRLNDIVRGRRGITADTALRLARLLRTSPQFWVNLQTSYELRAAEAKSGRLIEKQVRPMEAA